MGEARLHEIQTIRRLRNASGIRLQYDHRGAWVDREVHTPVNLT